MSRIFLLFLSSFIVYVAFGFHFEGDNARQVFFYIIPEIFNILSFDEGRTYHANYPGTTIRLMHVPFAPFKRELSEHVIREILFRTHVHDNEMCGKLQEP